ncbi:MAG: universal stress protein [Actinobacteria bacterium HGW-Actinobacteria-7]|jgi:nucleotide-binding universal stress UspA family protein|nr:MAG: universal stress protein [Actinobacteria bacterium HGW-Actinobacteria-7]
MKVCIKGAAEDVKLGDIQDVCLDFDRILLATDGSEPAILATQYAVTMAKTFGASIKAIYVDDGVEALQLPEEIEADDTWEGYHPSVKGLGVAKVMCERNGVECEIEIIQGGVTKRIIRTAEAYGADLIVLGETGRTGLKRLGMGSIAETVLRGAPMPVLVCKAE